jgi:hypothetical protein
MPKSPFEKLLKRVSGHYESDLILYMGPLDRPYDDKFIERVKGFKQLNNVLLILTTNGGDPHAAYRIGRCLQEKYETVSENVGPNQSTTKGKFRLFVDTRCKSAGTILAAGANILLFSDYGELGPIDVQIRKSEEVGERDSVLTPRHALESLQAQALHHFASAFTELRFSNELAFTTKLAADVARDMSVGLLNPIYAQIDPMRLGEYDRAMRIASEYARRLGVTNLKEGALERLVQGYPAHGFVIDKKEANELFKNVEEPTSDLLALGEITRGWAALNPSPNEPILYYLTTAAVLSDDEEEGENAASSNEGTPDAAKNETEATA